MIKPNSTLGARLWPTILDRQTARKIAREAFWAAIIVVVITVAFATLAVFGTSLAGIGPAAFVDAAIFGVVAAGIHRMSRVAALAGLIIFGLEKLLMIDQMLSLGNIIMAIALLFAFANGVRATFAYHRLQALSVTPSLGIIPLT